MSHDTPPSTSAPAASSPAAAAAQPSTGSELREPPSQPRRQQRPLAGLPLTSGHTAIVGMQWGDEGKGKVVDLLSEHYDLIVRYNGGANAGHSVQVGDERYALHLIPSGILYPDKINVIGNGVVVDPDKLIDEIEGLTRRGVNVASNLRISSRAHVVMPYHKLQDALMEGALAKSNGESKRIGTTGRGIGPCYADKALRSTAVRVCELLQPELLASRLAHVVRLKNRILGALAEECGEAFEPLDAETLTETALAWGQRLKDHVCDSTALLHEAANSGKQILFEGANATLLDIDHGTYPYVTSSNCSSLGVHPGTGVPGHMVREVVGIVKAYQTRVGGGPMPTELFDATGQRIRDVGKEYGTTTGRPRRCGWLDLVALRYAARISGATALGIMLLDVLADLPQLKLCVAYRDGGKVLSEFPADAEVLDRAEPVYESLPGFAGPVSDCQEFDQLPQNAQGYVRQIERHVGVPVRLISLGPGRHQTLVMPC